MSFLRRTVTLALLAAASLIGPSASPAQVLARPGWAGSGVTPEPWWRRAVFYRIQPAFFQATGDASQGDLRGIAQRLGYLQQLGVDAIVLRLPFSPDDFGDLARQASQSHLRVLVQLASADPAQARLWLNQGAAGLYLDAHNLQGSVTPASVAALRKLTDSFPGQRVLLTSGIASTSAQLTVAEDITATRPDAAVLRRQLASNLDGFSSTANPLLDLAGVGDVGQSAQQEAILDRSLALMLFASRAAVLFDAGRELGLRSLDGAPVIMQWTPTNITAATTEAAAAPKTDEPAPIVYGAFTPYIPPSKAVQALPPPPKPVVVESSLPSIATLPGFTAGKLPANTPVNGAASNAASEDRDPNSLLNFYRHLIALHHGDWTLRNGTQTIRDRDAQDSLVWVRRAPAGTTTTASAVIACNLGSKPVTLSLNQDLAAMQMRTGPLRALLTASTTPTDNLVPYETTGELNLAPQSIFLGELIPGSASYTTHHHRR